MDFQLEIWSAPFVRNTYSELGVACSSTCACYSCTAGCFIRYHNVDLGNVCTSMFLALSIKVSYLAVLKKLAL